MHICDVESLTLQTHNHAIFSIQVFDMTSSKKYKCRPFIRDRIFGFLVCLYERFSIRSGN